MEKNEIIEKRFKEELSSYELYLLFKDVDIELSKMLLLECYLLNIEVNLNELANLFEKTNNKEIAKNIYLLDSINNNDSKEKYNLMKTTRPNDTSSKYLEDYISLKKSNKIMNLICSRILKIKYDKNRIKKLEKFVKKSNHPDALVEIANYYLNKNDKFEAKKYLGCAAYKRADAAIMYLNIYNTNDDIKDNIAHLKMVRKYNNLNANFEYSKIIINNENLFKTEEIILAKNDIYNLYDHYDDAKLFLANYNLDKDIILSFFLYKTLSIKESYIDKNIDNLKEKILKNIKDKINYLLIENNTYEKTKNKSNVEEIKKYYQEALNLDLENAVPLYYKAALLGHKSSLKKCVNYYKELNGEKYLEILLYQYYFEDTLELMDEINDINITPYLYLKNLLKVRKKTQYNFDDVLENKIKINADFKLLYKYYSLINNFSKLSDEFKNYKKLNKNDSILDFLVYQESNGDLNATQVLIDFYLENQIEFHYDLEVYEELVKFNHIYSANYLLNYYKNNDERKYIELSLEYIDQSFVDFEYVINTSINSLELYYLILCLIEENRHLDLLKRLICSRGENDKEFYYLNKFYEYKSIELSDFIDYLDEYISIENASLTLIDFLKFLKKNEEELATKYVNLFVKNKKYEQTFERLNEIIEESKLKNERKEKRIKKYTRQARRGNKLAMTKLIKYNDSLSNAERNELLYRACENNNYSSLKLLVVNYGFDFIRSHNRFKSLIMELSKYKYNDYACYIAAKVYENEEYCKEFNVEYSLEKSFENYKASSMISEEKIKKEVWLKLAYFYENGIGTNVNLKEASKYYELYDYPKAKELIDKYNLNEFLENSRKQTREVFSKYPCAAYNSICINDPPFAKKIFERLITLKKENIEQHLKRRDYLLSIGLTMYEIYDETGYLSESRIASKVKQIEDEIRRKKLEEENKKLEKIKQEQLLKQKQYQAEEQKKIEDAKKVASTNSIVSQQKSFNKPYNSSAFISTNIQKPKITISDNSPYLLELNPSFLISQKYTVKAVNEEIVKGKMEGIAGDDEKRLIASLRERLKYPLEPKLSLRDEYGGKISERKAFKIYNEEIENRKQYLDAYFERLYSEENPILKYGYMEYRKSTWNLKRIDNVILRTEFVKELEKYLKSKYNCYINVIKATFDKFYDSENKALLPYQSIERMIQFLPNYIKEMKIVIDVTVRVPKYYDNAWEDLYDYKRKIENKYNISHEFTDALYSDVETKALRHDLDAQDNAEAKAKNMAYKYIKTLVDEFVSNYKIFAGTNYTCNGKKQYVEGEVLKVYVEYKYNYLDDY